MNPSAHSLNALIAWNQTTLLDLGIADKTIQTILRHPDMSVTQRCQIRTPTLQSISPMIALESECALSVRWEQRFLTPGE